MDLHLDRYREIAEILSRNGLSFLINQFGLHRFVPANLRRFIPDQDDRDGLANPAVVRRTLEQLGPTFIKFGQLLSTRSDLLPPSYVSELAKLQDSAPPVDHETIHRLIREELGSDPDRVFASFENAPLASASIGQAHAAVLHDGTDVVVKVRREGVVEQIEEDLEILANITRYADRNWTFMENYNIVAFVDQFSDSLRAEVDYNREGRNAERMADNFDGDPVLHVPRVFWEFTTARVLTEERIVGAKISALAELDRTGVDRSRLAHDATRLILDMLFRDGFFHADPHPGNLLIEPGGTIGLIDFGMVGEIDDRLRRALVHLVIAAARGDTDRMAGMLLQVAPSKGRVHRKALSRDLAKILKLIDERALADISMSDILTRILDVLRKNTLQLPQELVLMIRMITMVEGIGTHLDPEFKIMETVKPYALRLIVQRYAPQNALKGITQRGFELLELGAMLPDQVVSLLEGYEQKGVKISIDADDIDPYVGRVETMVNRLIAGIIVASMLNLTGDVALSQNTTLRKVKVPLVAGSLTVAGALGGWLALSGKPLRRFRQHRR